MVARLFLLNALLTTLFGAHATIYVTNPVSGGSYTAGQSITVSWLDNGDAPLLSNIGSCNVALYLGDGALVQQIDQVDVAETTSLTFTPNAAAGPNSGDYYVQFTSASPVDGSTLYEYSPNFALSGMTGSSGSAVPSLTSAVPTVIASSVSGSAAPTPSSPPTSVASSAASSVSSSASAASSSASAASSAASSASSAASSAASSQSSAASSAASSVSSAASSAASSLSSAASSLSSGFSTARSSTSPSASVTGASSQSSSAALGMRAFSVPLPALFALLGVVAGAAML